MKLTATGIQLIYLGKHQDEHIIAELAVAPDDPRNMIQSTENSGWGVASDYRKLLLKVLSENDATSDITVEGYGGPDRMTLPMVEYDTYPDHYLQHPVYVIRSIPEQGGNPQTYASGAWEWLPASAEYEGKEEQISKVLNYVADMIRKGENHSHCFQHLKDTDGADLGFVRYFPAYGRSYITEPGWYTARLEKIVQVNSTGVPYDVTNGDFGHEILPYTDGLDFYITGEDDHLVRVVKRINVDDTELSDWFFTMSAPPCPGVDECLSDVLLTVNRLYARFATIGHSSQQMNASKTLQTALDALNALAMNGVSNNRLGNPKFYAWMFNPLCLVYSARIEEATDYLETTFGIKRNFFEMWVTGRRRHDLTSLGHDVEQNAMLLIGDSESAGIPFMQSVNPDMYQ